MATLTTQEVMFLNRVAARMAADGSDMEAAGKAVLADDRAAAEKVQSLNNYDRAAFTKVMAGKVFINIHSAALAA